MNENLFNLQLFADGGSAGGDGGAAAAAGGESGVSVPDAGAHNNRRKHEDQLANVKYSIQRDGAQPVAPAQQAAEQGAESRKSFKELIDGEYKDEANAYIQSIIQSRFPRNAENETRLESLKPLLDAVSRKFGVDASDIDGMIDALSIDEAELEEEAELRGMPKEAVRKLKATERKAEKYDKMMENHERMTAFQRARQAHHTSLAMQAEEVKAAYPEFDLEREMANPTFMRMTAPGGGLSAKQAYEAIHHGEILEAALRRQNERVSRSIQANGARPVENGVNGAQSASPLKTDPRTYNKAEREAIRKLVESGQRVVLG